MFASGVPTAEKPQAERYYLKAYGPNAEYPYSWANYQAYLHQTSILIPMPPFLYKGIPTVLKQTVLLDFPFYHFDENTDGPKAIEEATSA